MLLTELTYENLDEFNKEHDFDCEEGFFTHKTQAELQKIVDQTLDSLRHKREITGESKLAEAALALLKKAGSADTKSQVWVRWGLHQLEEKDARGDSGGQTKLHHFTVTTLITGENDWHFYVDKLMHTIMYMSRSRTELVKIENV
jgi:hypothetical protein